MGESVSVFGAMGVLLSVILNALVVIAYAKKGKDVTYKDLMLVSMAVSDLIQAGVGYGTQIHQQLYRSAGLSKTGCHLAGFVVTGSALTSIAHLLGICVERAVMLWNPLRSANWERGKKLCLYVIVPAWSYGLVLATLPLLGWSSYVPGEGGEFFCGPNFHDRSSNSLTYLYTILSCSYIIPLVGILLCCYLCIRALQKMSNACVEVDDQVPGPASAPPQTVNTEQRGMSDVYKRLQRGITTMSFCMVGVFLLAWTPYATCVIVLALGGTITPSAEIVAALLGKTSTLYNPIIYLVFMKDFRERCKRLIGWKSNRVNPELSAAPRGGEQIEMREQRPANSVRPTARPTV